MYGPVANTCEHAYEARILGGHPISVRLCILCHTPDWDDLYQQADTLFRWGREEGLAGKPQRERISAYDMPREGSTSTLPASEAGESTERAAIRKVSVRFELEQVRADLARSSEQVIDLARRAETAEHRLRLAHQARRAKEHQLDGIRRALCDIGFMDDDDPYSHADLADVIRQNGQALADTSSSGQERDDAQVALARVRAFATQLEEFAENALKEDDRKLYAALARDLRTRIGDAESGPVPAGATAPARCCGKPAGAVYVHDFSQPTEDGA